MAQLLSPFDTVKYCTPKRVRLSLKHHDVRSPPEPEPTDDSVCEEYRHMFVYDSEIQDENISPNCIRDEVNRTHKVSFIGLPNCGNTCYLNSILQVLRFTPNFLSTLHSLATSQTKLTQVK